MELQFQPGTSSLVPRTPEAASAKQVDDEEPRIYSGHGAGGKFRKSRKGLKKPTPYDRPGPARHAVTVPASPGSVASSSSLASRLVDSASRLITSSVSYLFPALFGRKILSLPQVTACQDEEVIVVEHDEEEPTEIVTNRGTQIANKTATAQEQDQLASDVGFEKTVKREFDLAHVEDILKQKAWSRDQVSRLTEILSTRLTEDHPTVSQPLEAGPLPNVAAANAGELTFHRDEKNEATPISEAQRWREERKHARTDCVPVEVAKAYMGDRTSVQSSFTHSFRASAHQLDRVAELQPPPGLGLTEERYRCLPVLRSRTRSTAPHLAKKSPYLDEDWMSLGPVRRTRHKQFHVNSSPYLRELPAVEHPASRTYMSPPVQSRLTAQKILDALEVLSPVPTSKHTSDEPPEVGSSGKFKSQGSQGMHQFETFQSHARNLGISNGRLRFGSPPKLAASATGTKKDLHSEDKSLVNKLFPSIEAGTSASLPSSSVAAMSVPFTSSSFPFSTSSFIMFTQPESKASSTLALPPLKPDSSHIRTGEVFAPTKGPSLAFSPHTSVASKTAIDNPEIAFPLPSPSRKEYFGTDGLFSEQRKESKRGNVDHKEKLNSFQFRAASARSPFTFNAGSVDSSWTEKGSPSSSLQDGAPGTQSESQPPVNKTTVTAVTLGQSLFGSSSGSSPLFKLSGQSFGASSISKPSYITPLTLEASSAPFTFSPPPPQLVSCSTPTFSFSSITGPATVPFEAASSTLEVSNVSPVYNFTSPSAGPELPVPTSEGKSSPAPSFTFGVGTMSSLSSGAGLDSTFCHGSGTQPLGTSSPASMSARPVTQNLAASDAMPQPSKFGGQSTSGQLFQAAQSSPFSFVEYSQVSTGLATFSTGANVAEKTGRKFVKVKRRK